MKILCTGVIVGLDSRQIRNKDLLRIYRGNILRCNHNKNNSQVQFHQPIPFHCMVIIPAMSKCWYSSWIKNCSWSQPCEACCPPLQFPVPKAYTPKIMATLSLSQKSMDRTIWWVTSTPTLRWDLTLRCNYYVYWFSGMHPRSIIWKKFSEDHHGPYGNV